MKKQIKNKIVWMEIFLLVGASFAFAYILRESFEGLQDAGSGMKQRGRLLSILPLLLKIAIRLLFTEKTLVSALENKDLEKGVSTCAKGKDGSICQEYPASECAGKCAEVCIPTRRNEAPGCKLGTCYDSDIGTCQERSPENECKNKGGQWLDNEAGNLAECQKACCVVGDSVIPLITARECVKIGERIGVTTNYRADVKNELACRALERTKVEGACIFKNDEGKKCRFITKGKCTEDNGEFYEGYLCTHPDFGLKYQKQASARCVEGEDGIYWFDSEGNRENIYDANKAKSWNNGMILNKEKSCSLGDKSNSLSNQKTCGNCNRFLGSICGQKNSKEKLADNSISFVCRDSRCFDNNGNTRQNGESWCEYQGQTGEDKGSGGFSRSVDTPGSKHFRATCLDGEVQVNPCGDYRNEICIEEQNKREDGKKISSSACVTNLWQLCLSYNTEVKGKGEERTKSIELRDDKCVKNPLCILKKVDIADNFKFDLCVPKYAPGFDLNKNAEGGELSCVFANQKCTVLYVKKISGWEVEVNEGCLKPRFAEQMNDLCISLGDCGASANYIGDLTENYKVYKSPKLGTAYFNGIKKYSESVKGEYAQINATEYLNAIGGIEKLGGKFKDPTPDELGIGSTISGLTGTALLFFAGTEFAAATPFIVTPAISVSYVGAAGALAGAAIGFAVTSLLIQVTGIGAGLDPAITWALIGAGTVAGALIGYTVIAAGGLKAAAGACAAGGVGCVGVVILVIVLIVIAIMAALGIGDTKKKIVEFQCQPWQAKLGGDKCGECGRDGYPCSKYACQSLGQTCRLINEDTIEQKCVDISPNDVSAPIIRPWKETLNLGYKYEEVSDSGFKIVNQENDGCVPSYTRLISGINLNELGYCKYDIKHTNNFDEMEFDFGSRNLFLENHSQLFTMPDLTSLGVPGYDPKRRADLNYYVRCIDGNGNGKESREYVINFCVKPGEDKTPPIITKREPIREEVKFDAKKLDAVVFTLEPATCRWSLDDKKYDDMENKFECGNDIVDIASIFGWECKTTFEVNKDDNLFYVRCKDQPWYGENWEGEGSDTIKKDESKRNEMPNAYEFKIKRTTNPLVIDYIKPSNETLKFGVEPATVILELQTSGGVDGRATCRLFGKEIAETFGKIHKQVFNQISSGEYEFPLICEDAAGNIAEITSRFKAELDANPPKVTRAYNLGESLIIITDEEAECGFVKDVKINACGFDFARATLMSGIEKSHSYDFDGNVHYIKCKDKWGNIPGDCSIILRGD